MTQYFQPYWFRILKLPLDSDGLLVLEDYHTYLFIRTKFFQEIIPQSTALWVLQFLRPFKFQTHFSCSLLVLKGPKIPIGMKPSRVLHFIVQTEAQDKKHRIFLYENDFFQGEWRTKQVLIGAPKCAIWHTVVLGSLQSSLTYIVH